MENKISSVEEKEISIIVPIYNGERFIDQLMTQFGYMNQENIEMILIDDGSNDSSWKLMLEKSKIHKNIRVYHKGNGGIASTRNCGLRYAKGKYVVFMDQDDQCDFNILLNTCQQLKKTEADFCVANYSVIRHYEGESNEEKIEAILDDRLIPGENLVKISKDFLTSRRVGYSTMSKECKLRGVPPVVWNCIFCREFLEKNNICFLKFVDYEDDFTFLVQCLGKARKIYISKERYYKWMIRENSESHRDKYIENFREKRLQLNQWLWEMGKKCGIQGDDLYTFECWLYKLLCVKGFSNTCSRANQARLFEKSRELKQIVESNTKREKLKYEDSYCEEKIIIYLLKHKLFVVAIIWDSVYKVVKNLKDFLS